MRKIVSIIVIAVFLVNNIAAYAGPVREALKEPNTSGMTVSRSMVGSILRVPLTFDEDLEGAYAEKTREDVKDLIVRFAIALIELAGDDPRLYERWLRQAPVWGMSERSDEKGNRFYKLRKKRGWRTTEERRGHEVYFVKTPDGEVRLATAEEFNSATHLVFDYDRGRKDRPAKVFAVGDLVQHTMPPISSGGDRILDSEPGRYPYTYYAERLGIEAMVWLDKARMTHDDWLHKANDVRVQTHRETMEWLDGWIRELMMTLTRETTVKVHVTETDTIDVDITHIPQLICAAFLRRAEIGDDNNALILFKPADTYANAVLKPNLDTILRMRDLGETVTNEQVLDELMSPAAIFDVIIGHKASEGLIKKYEGEVAKGRVELQRTLNVLRRLKEKNIPFYLEGYRVMDSIKIGPSKGGIRYAISAVFDLVRTLAGLMTLKCSLANIAYGGGKGEVSFILCNPHGRFIPDEDGRPVSIDPRLLPAKDRAEISRGFARGAEGTHGLAWIIGSLRDVPAGDMNTDSSVMSWIADEILKICAEEKWNDIDGIPVPIDILTEVKKRVDEDIERDEYDPTDTSYVDAILAAFKEGHEEIKTLALLGMITGKPFVDKDAYSETKDHVVAYKGGNAFRDHSTGVAQVHATAYAISKGIVNGLETLQGASAAIQGFGAVGLNAARATHNDFNARVMGLSDISGSVYVEKGRLPVDKIIAWFETEEARTGYYPILLDWYNERGKYLGVLYNKDSKFVLYMNVDVVFPDALQEQITSQNADKIQAQVVSEGANAPTTPEADKILQKKGIVVLPDFWANGGGVICSYFEWVDNMTMRLDDLRGKSEEELYDETKQKVFGVMQRSFDRMLAYCKDKAIPYTELRLAGRIIAIKNILEVEDPKGKDELGGVVFVRGEEGRGLEKRRLYDLVKGETRTIVSDGVAYSGAEQIKALLSQIDTRAAMAKSSIDLSFASVIMTGPAVTYAEGMVRIAERKVAAANEMYERAKNTRNRVLEAYEKAVKEGDTEGLLLRTNSLRLATLVLNKAIVERYSAGQELELAKKELVLAQERHSIAMEQLEAAYRMADEIVRLSNEAQIALRQVRGAMLPPSFYTAIVEASILSSEGVQEHAFPSLALTVLLSEPDDFGPMWERIKIEDPGLYEKLKEMAEQLSDLTTHEEFRLFIPYEPGKYRLFLEYLKSEYPSLFDSLQTIGQVMMHILYEIQRDRYRGEQDISPQDAGSLVAEPDHGGSIPRRGAGESDSGSVLSLLATMANPPDSAVQTQTYNVGDTITVQDLAKDRGISETTARNEIRDGVILGLFEPTGALRYNWRKSRAYEYRINAKLSQSEIDRLSPQIKAALTRGRIRPEDILEIQNAINKVATTPVGLRSRKDTVASMDDITVVRAATIKGKSEKEKFMYWLATKVGANQAVVVIADSLQEYKEIQDLKDLVHIKVNNITREQAMMLRLEDYQILDLTGVQIKQLVREFEIYEDIGIPFVGTVRDKLDPAVVEQISNGV